MSPAMAEAFFICRPMTAQEWLALDPRQRTSTLDMTDASKDEDAREEPER